jgi:predicted acetyltransferase
VDIEIRGIDRSEVREVLRVDSRLFGYAVREGDSELDHLPLDRMLCAFEGGRMVGTSAVLPLELTLPGGARVAMAGVTWVGVLATHRRRGVMRRLVVEQLTRAERAGEPVAGLGASQSLLYRRFGFGPASRAAYVELDAAHSAYIDPVAPDGRLRHLELDEALDALPRLHEKVRARRNGMVSRTAALHRRAYEDAAKEKDGAGPVCFVAHSDAGGEIDGVVAYRFRLSVDSGEVFDGDVRIVELLATDDAAAAALWRHCLDHDLSRRVFSHNRPIDEAVADRLADPRRWSMRPRDDLHLRPLDVAALLAARRYGREDALTVEVHDPLFDHLGGCFHVEGGLDGASARRVDGAPDIVLGTAALGSILLGDAPVERLQRAGLVEERTRGAVTRATAKFSWSPRPWASYMF